MANYMAEPYYSYGGNQPFYNNENSFTYYSDGYDNYGYYAEYNTPQYLPQPPVHYRHAPPQRSPTPPPPPTEPSPEYLATSLAEQNNAPPGQRKLLIFDLNGTLLLRSSRAYAGARKIYLRPYARALVAYISHPTVGAWLDCMVWSSAQAHNVREMVERVFGAAESTGTGPILRAVWARDTLGLSREAFHQKTQTTKDLAKPWAFFSGLNSSQQSVYTPTDYNPNGDEYTAHPDHIPAHFPPAQPSWSSTPSTGWDPQSMSVSNLAANAATDSDAPDPPHGPHTTLLVDDSPLKARLQPWNHLCVVEYDAAARARDRAAAALPPDELPPVPVNASHRHVPNPPRAEPIAAELERKRLRAAAAAAGGDAEEGEVGEASGNASASTDGSPSSDPVIAQEHADGSGDASLPASSPVNVDQTEGSPRKRKREVEEEQDPRPVGAHTAALDVPDADAPPPPPPDTTEHDTGAPPPDAPPAADADADAEPYDPTLLAVVGVLAHVRNVGNVAAWVRGGGLAAVVEAGTDAKQEPREDDSTQKETAPASDPAQWFDSPRVLRAWAARGRTALAELGIDAAPGVE
ncbi:hypothetical protein DFH09DRAFT_583571 [Mycena vulgaris]|nr:hypothetical protein DFH09DRAFT_583571 [Mycena vulgaris]